jgi:hypothetical protein
VRQRDHFFKPHQTFFIQRNLRSDDVTAVQKLVGGQQNSQALVVYQPPLERWRIYTIE